MMKFYHYTSADKLRRISQDHNESGYEALKPRRRFIPIGAAPADLPKKKYEPAIFGLLDPLDKKWCVTTYFPDEPLLETVLGDISDRQLFLLEINVTQAEDIYVADHSPHLREDYDGARGANKGITHQVKHAYWESLMPFTEYLAKDISYGVPEVICFSPIPLKQIRLVETTDSEVVINHIREKGGFLPHPLRSKPDPEVQARMFREIFGLDKPEV